MLLKEKYGDYISYLRQKGLSEKTIKEHGRFLFGSLSHSVEDVELKKLKMVDVAKVIESGRQHGEFGPQRSVVVFRRYLKFLKESGLKVPFDYRDLEVPRVAYKEPLVFDKKELLKLFNSFPLKSPHCDARLMAWSMRALCETQFGSVMRIFEALSLTLEKWGLIKAQKEIIIKGKGGGERIVYFSDRAILWIKKYLKVRKEITQESLMLDLGNTALFVNGCGDPLKYVTAKSYWLRHREEWGIGKKWRSHTFRRTGITHLYDNGADIKSISHIAGHKSIRTTLTNYIYLDKRKVKKVFEKCMTDI